jgi:fermentation-respiration switch protein FrsA (DUF1100 family)
MKTNVTFDSAGLKLAGHLYTPDDDPAGGRRPAIVVGHPMTGVKEQTAGLYAERLSRQGFVTLAFDSAHWGESEGEPRFLEDPSRRVEDIKNAVSFLSLREEVDPERIAALGICASGGYVVPAAATDHRIKSVATVSAVEEGRFYRNGVDGTQGPEVLQAMLDSAAASRTEEAQGKPHGSRRSIQTPQRKPAPSDNTPTTDGTTTALPAPTTRARRISSRSAASI